MEMNVLHDTKDVEILLAKAEKTIRSSGSV